MAIDIAIAMTVSMAVDNALADATAVVIIHPSQKHNLNKTKVIRANLRDFDLDFDDIF